MCLLVIFHRVVEDAHLIVGANREEAYARGGEAPQIVAGNCRFVAGIDPVAGGTWLGVNEHGVLVALTNRSKSEVPEQGRSRGLLRGDLLDCRTAAAAAIVAGYELGQPRYAGCNILCADQNTVIALHGGDWLRVRPLPPGLHVLSAHDINDGSDRRIGHALWWLNGRHYAVAEDCVTALKELCSQTGNGGPPMCIRREQGGTVSSTIIVLRPELDRSLYLHAQGPPDQTPYMDYSQLLAQISPVAPQQ